MAKRDISKKIITTQKKKVEFVKINMIKINIWEDPAIIEIRLGHPYYLT